MRSGSGKPLVDRHIYVPEPLYAKLESYTRRFPKRSMNMLILTAIELYVKRLEEAESKNVVSEK